MSEMGGNVGDVWIEAHADTSRLSGELRAAAAAAAEMANIELEVDLDEADLAAKVKAAAVLAGQVAEIEMTAKLNAARLKAEAAALAKAASEDIEFKAKLDPTLINRLRGQAGQFTKLARSAESLQVKIDADTSPFRKALDELRQQRFDEIKLSLTIEEQEKAKIRAEMDRLTTNLPPVQLKLNVPASELAEVEAKIAAIVRDRTAQLRINTRTSAINASIDGLRRKLEANPIKMPVQPDLLDTAFFRQLRERLRSVKRIPLPLSSELDSKFFANLRNQIASRPIRLPIEIELERRGFGESLFRRLSIRAREFWHDFGDLGRSAIAGINETLGGSNGIFQKAGVVLGFLTAQALLVVGAITLLLPLIKALAVAAAGVVVEVGALGLTLGSFAAVGLASLAAGVGVALIGVQGLGTAFTTMGKILDKERIGLKASKGELQAYQEALKRLSPQARQFVLSIEALAPALRKLQLKVQNELFRGLGEQLRRTAQADLPFLQKGLVGIATIINQAATSFLRWARSTEGALAINSVLTIIQQNLGNLLTAIGNVAHGLLTLFIGSGDNATRLSDALVTLTDNFDKWTKKITTPGKNGKSPLDDFFEKTMRTARNLKGILGDILTIIGSFFTAWFGSTEQTGKDPLTSLRESLDKVAKWVKENPTALKDWVTDNMARFGELVTAVKSIATSLNTLSTKLLEVDASARQLTGSGLFEWLSAVAIAVDNWAKTLAGMQPLDWNTLFPPPPGLPEWLTIPFWTKNFNTSALGQFWAKHGKENGAEFFGGIIQGLKDGFANSAIGQLIFRTNDVSEAGRITGKNFLRGIIQGFLENITLIGIINKILIALGREPITIDWVFADKPAEAPPWAGTPGNTNNAPPFGQPPVIPFNTKLNPPTQEETDKALKDLQKKLQQGLTGGAISLTSPFDDETCRRIFGPIFACIPELVNRSVEQAGEAARDIPPQFAPVVPGLEQWRGPIDSTIRSWFAGGPGYARTAANGIVSAFSGLAGRIAAAAGNVAGRIKALFAGVVAAARDAASAIVSAFTGLGASIVRAIGPIVIKPTVDLSALNNIDRTPTLSGFVPDSGPAAGGGAGSVSALLASMATTLPTASVPADNSAAGGVRLPEPFYDRSSVGAKNPVNIYVTVPTDDPEAAAMAVMNRLSAALAL